MDKAKTQKLLGESWIVNDILSKGQYGSVVKAQDILAGKRYYAVKVVKYSSEDQIKYRMRELNLLVGHAPQPNANVIQYHHAWPNEDSKDNQRFLLIKMELCYLDLYSFMTMNNREATSTDGFQGLSIVKEANFYKFVFPQILNGLNVIHSMKPKWVHRDISLRNILVQYPIPKSIQEIKIKIGGFGVARQLPESSIHLSNAAKLDEIQPESGRGLYQAPEMAEEIYCEKVDLYSAGIVLYLLSSYPENEKQWPSDEIEALKVGKRNKSNLCHYDKVLAELLFSPTNSLLHRDPEKRPSAEEALYKLPLQEKLQTLISSLPDNLTLVNARLGKGSYAEVISVQHRIDKYLYAVKIINRDDVPLKYQQRELDILTKQVGSSTAQNNIVRYYDSWEQEFNSQTFLCIRMELCDTSLKTILQKKPQIVDEEMFHKHVFRQLLQALDYIHGIRIIHRDVYPSNILIRTPEKEIVATWVIKLADFGLARQLDESFLFISDQPLNMSRVGNEYYRAPEISNKKYDTKVDMYSAGVVLYQMCRFLENDEKIMDALSKLKKEKMVDRNRLSFSDDRLYNLMNDLVKPNPRERPNAKEAGKKFLDYIRSKDSCLSHSFSEVVSLDEPDGKSERSALSQPRSQAVEHGDDEEDDFKDGLC